MLLCPVLLAVTQAFTQQFERSGGEPQSIIALAPSPKPQGALLARRAGDATFEHAPANYHVFAAATAGEDAGVETLTLNFAAETKLTRIESKNKDFVVEPGGTCHEGNSYGRGKICTLTVRFNPQGPGHRLGFLSITHTAAATPMVFGLVGNGYAPVVSFIPALITTIGQTSGVSAGTIKSATRLAIDGSDTLYIADTGNNLYKEIDSSNTITKITPSYAPPLSIAVDSFGDVYNINTQSQYYFGYISPLGSQSAFSNTYTPTTCTESSPCSMDTGVGWGAPANTSMDANDNLFLQEATEGAVEMPVAAVAGGGSSFDFWHLNAPLALPGTNAPSFAVDGSGNLYSSLMATTGSKLCWIVEETLATAATTAPDYSRVAGGSKCGFSGDGAQAGNAEISSNIGQMAFDVAGNLYFADAGNQRVRRIDALTGIIRTVAGSGGNGYNGDQGPATSADLSNPTGVAVDSQGQVYILSSSPASAATQVVRKVWASGYLSFPALDKGLSGSLLTVTVSNSGNHELTFEGAATFSGGNAGDFAIDPKTTSCVTPGGTLEVGESCVIGILFSPSGTGLRGTDLYLPDNTIAGRSLIEVTGTGVLPQPNMSITAPASGSTITAGATVTFSASVKPSVISQQPTGTVKFEVNGTVIGNPVTLSSTGTASTTFVEEAAGSYTLSAVYSGDSNYAAETVPETVTVATIKTPVTVSLIPAVESAYGCGATSFAVQVSAKTGGSPTGTVELLSNSTVLASARLQNGAATLSPHALPPGSHTFVARYNGDSTHEAAISPSVGMTAPSSRGSCGGGLPLPGPER
ncbi:MAG TPA: Ig-like domain repeat protein [Terracidiphilus sp.]|nr:Ig-like domain repeat protein [Terracidiphilus sp.]